MNEKLYSANYDGALDCLDFETGDVLWSFLTDEPGLAAPYPNYSFWGHLIGADNKIFAPTSSFFAPDPLWQGMRLYVVDAESGEEVWSISGMFNNLVIADGILVGHNNYEQEIYGFGKGPSEITANASPKIIPLGNWVQIEGSVTDISAGATQDEKAVRFPNGVPAIADEHMSEWMEYVYMQSPRPENAVGVPVKIQIIDPDGEYAWIGTTTSDSYGNYAYSFIPQKKGTYTVIATFDGSESYWGSQTTTYLTVGDAIAPYPSYPGYQGPSAQEVANRVVANLPADATPQDVAQAVVNAMPEYPEIPEQQEIPDYTNILIVLIAAIAIIAFLVIYTIYKVNKLK
jgi:hypothetical protein